MEQTLEERIEQRIKEIAVTEDDYNDTIHAIIGFTNLYLLDDTFKPRPHVKGFQGRHLTPLPAGRHLKKTTERHVTPDLGIVINDNKGILGEVHKNFPKVDVERKKKEFVQLKNYDQDLIGWPVTSEKVNSHEIVLLVHLTTSAYAKEFYQEQLSVAGIVFDRPFSIVEFGRTEQAQTFFFFKTVLGEPLEIDEEKKLKYGVAVPMRVFVREYAKTKLYDAQPPLTYLTQLIWEHIVVQIASKNPKFEHLHKNQKIEVTLEIEDIVQILDESFSFRIWHSRYPKHQPRIPHTEWVRPACQFLVESGEAKWVEGSDYKQVVIFYQTYADVKDHFVLSHATLEENKLATPMLPGFRPIGN